MQLGVVFPQTEIGPDPGPIRAYAGAVADLGYRHLLTYDHVVGADPAVYPGWAGPTTFTARSTRPSCCSGIWQPSRVSSWSPAS